MIIWKKHRPLLRILCILLIGLGIGWFAASYSKTNALLSPPVSVRENSPTFKFINPFIFSKTSKKFYADEYQGLNTSFTNAIQAAIQNSTAEDASVYYRDLNSGHWTGVNEEDTYEPGSMLKVVVMVGTLKLALSEPNILSKTLDYENPIDQAQYYKPAVTLSLGNHNVQELLNSMIVDSDNGAAEALLSNTSINNSFQDTYKTFLLPSLASPTTTDYMSPRVYSVVFRTLYDSTYLTWDLSNQALGLLSRTNFTKGIVAGVPAGTAVAHKFGEHTTLNISGGVINRELHDCGIVYYPNSPYLLCVMTRGQDYPQLETVIQSLSKIAYDYTDSLHK